ncbi:MAG TPA: PKD domain-containing protein [Streptosporangiaceae bacterium]
MRLPHLRRAAAVIALLCATAMTWAVPAGAAVPASAVSWPAAELSIEPGTGPLSVTLAAASARFPAHVVSYLFHFGDGHTATTTSRTVTHTYPSAGRFTPEVTETDANGDMASATGVLELGTCPTGPTCTQTLRNVSGVQQFSATGSTQPGVQAAVDLFVGPYKIKNCDPSVKTDGALTDSGFAGNLTVTVVYRANNPALVNTTCFASLVPFKDAQGQTVTSGALPMCLPAAPMPPCVMSISTMMTGSGLQATKVLLIPPGDQKVGAL